MTLEEAKRRVRALEVAMGFGWVGRVGRVGPIMMMASDDAKYAARYRARRKLRTELGAALVDAGRLAEWNEGDRLAVDAALEQLTADWIANVRSDGIDPVPRGTDVHRIENEERHAGTDATAESADNPTGSGNHRANARSSRRRKEDE